MKMTNRQLSDDLFPLVAEFAWHSVTVDPSIQEVSDQHYTVVADVLIRYGQHLQKPVHILEVASYAHTTGYKLAELIGANVTLFDISVSTLKLGRQMAQTKNLAAESVRLVAGDFHALPFEDAEFDFVFICSALHHTWRWQLVASELTRVLAAGGLVLIENEPCHRKFCFYKFRTNRMSEFTDFEKYLDEIGLIRTVAEAYLGSRPETLFGMVENQTMPVDGIIEAFTKQGDLVDLVVIPEICMGDLERRLVADRYLPRRTVARDLLRDPVPEAGGAAVASVHWRALIRGFRSTSGRSVLRDDVLEVPAQGVNVTSARN